MPPLPVPAQTVLLLVGSNVFMTLAWYGHLRHHAAAGLSLGPPVHGRCRVLHVPVCRLKPGLSGQRGSTPKGT
jgi:hypothetical protein